MSFDDLSPEQMAEFTLERFVEIAREIVPPMVVVEPLGMIECTKCGGVAPGWGPADAHDDDR
jgi:hypothetical protein